MSESDQIAYDEFLSKTYPLMLSQEKSAALGYLNQAVNWQITIFTGGLIASFLQSGFPSFQSLCISAIVLVASFHMMTRAAKGYLNVVRFAQIERTLLCWMESANNEKNKQILFKSIRIYHTEWSSPLSAIVVLGKILLNSVSFFKFWPAQA